MPAVPSAHLLPDALRARFAKPPIWQPEVERETSFSTREPAPAAVLVPIVIGLACGAFAGLINGLLIAYTRIPPFIATLGMMVAARGASRWWSNGQPVSFPTESYGALSNGDVLGSLSFGLLSWKGQNPAVVLILLALLFWVLMSFTLYGKRTYAIGSNEAAARMSGINTDRHKVLV